MAKYTPRFLMARAPMIAARSHPQDDADEKPSPDRQAEITDGDPAAVASQPEIGRMAEGKDPRISQKEIKAQGKKAEDHDFRRQGG